MTDSLALNQVVKRALKGSARSFYLSLICFPASVKTQISVAYLFCKVADTIVDHNDYSAREKEEILNQFEQVVYGISPAEEWSRTVLSTQTDDFSNLLYPALPAALSLFRAFTREDQILILNLFKQVSGGIRRDLNGNAVTCEEDLDQYCYQVAGSVGEFLTELFYRYGYIECERREMISSAIELGKGLQLTNIIRDREEDRRNGRNYLPAGLPFCSQITIVQNTLFHLKQGLKFILYLPKRAWKIRLASFWPLLFALKTVAKCNQLSWAEHEEKVKISRVEIYLTLFISTLLIFSNRGIRFYFYSISNRKFSSQEVAG